jgi:hypothetical protein
MHISAILATIQLEDWSHIRHRVLVRTCVLFIASKTARSLAILFCWCFGLTPLRSLYRLVADIIRPSLVLLLEKEISFQSLTWSNEQAERPTLWGLSVTKPTHLPAHHPESIREVSRSLGFTLAASQFATVEFTIVDWQHFYHCFSFVLIAVSFLLSVVRGPARMIGMEDCPRSPNCCKKDCW